MHQAGGRNTAYRFTVLRHNAPQHAYYWLLRTPLSDRDDNDDDDGGPLRAFSGVLFNDLVADTSPFVNETRNYVRVDFQRDSDVRPLCADEYEMCWDSMMEVSVTK